MSGYNFKVPKKSWADVRELAQGMRNAFNLEDVANIPIMDLVESVMADKLGLFELDIVSADEMGPNEGETCQSGKLIRLREDVYIDACNNEARARFTVAHELGHWHMHTGDVVLARSEPGEHVPGYMASEAQANQYAAELLMPPKFFNRADTQMEIMSRHGVSASAADIRLRYLMEKGLI